QDSSLRVDRLIRDDTHDFVYVNEAGVEGVPALTYLLPPGVLRRPQKTRSRNALMLGVPGRVRIDHEGAVHALVDVPLQRQCMAVVEVAAERPGVELVDELVPRIDQAGARHAVHARRMNAVEVHRMRMRSLVPEHDA